MLKVLLGARSLKIHQVIHVKIRSKRVVARHRVVMQSNAGPELETSRSCPGFEFGWANEFLLLVGAGGQQEHHKHAPEKQCPEPITAFESLRGGYEGGEAPEQ